MDKKTLIRWLLVTWIAFLAFQAFVVLRFGEPWPAISMPRFANPGGESQVFTVTKPVLVARFTESKSSEIAVGHFLAMVPGSHRSTVMNENYRPITISEGSRSGDMSRDEVWTAKLKNWVRRTLRPPEVRVPASTEEGKYWTRHRLETLFPNQEPSHLEVQWRKITYQRSSERLTMTNNELIETLRIDL